MDWPSWLEYTDLEVDLAGPMLLMRLLACFVVASHRLAQQVTPPGWLVSAPQEHSQLSCGSTRG